MAKDELAAIPADPVNAIALLPGRDLLLVESNLSVFAVPDSRVRESGRRFPRLDFAELPCLARTPERWALSRTSAQLWVLDDARLAVGSAQVPFGGFEPVDLEPVEALLADDEGIVDVAANADGSRLLLQVTTGDDPAFELFVLRSFDPADGRSFELEDVYGIDAFTVEWSEAAGLFVVANIEAERVLTWDGRSLDATTLLDLEVEPSGRPPYSDASALAEVALTPGGESLRLSFQDEELDRYYVASLPLAPDAPPARRTQPLPPGSWFAFAWRREGPIGACIHESEEALRVALVSAERGALAECELPESWAVNCVAWSDDQQAVYIGTDHCLGVWTPQIP